MNHRASVFRLAKNFLRENGNPVLHSGRFNREDF